MVAYTFEGYWKDVGTVDSLYEANMDLLGDNPKFDVTDSSWKIQSRSPLAPPHFISEGAVVNNSIVMSGCEVYGEVVNSVLSSDVTISKGAIVKNSIIMSDVLIEEGAVVEYAIIDENTIISKGAIVGDKKEDGKGIALIGKNVRIDNGVKIDGGSIIDKDVVKEEK
jgi:glucose-1-phosphate adenylyltransferase